MKFSHLTSFSQSTVLWTKNIFTFFDRLENSSTFCAYPISTVKAAYLLFVVWWRRGRMVCRKRLRNWLQCRSPHAGRVGRNTAGGRQSCCSCYPGNSGAGHPSRGARGVRSPVSLFKNSLVQGWAVDSWSVCTSNMFTTVTCVIFHWLVLL